MSIHIFKTNTPVEATASGLSLALSGASEGAVLLMLSGGSAFTILDFLKVGTLGPHVTITVLDERFDPRDTVNNFAQLMKMGFYEVARERGCEFIDTRIRVGSPMHELAAAFEHSLRRWKDNHPDGKIVATMGIGEDGHTAGIMPFPEDERRFSELFESQSWAVSYDAGEKHEYSERVTVTNTFLRNLVDSAVAYATGENKRTSIIRTIGAGGRLAKTPARIFHEMKHVSFYTDLIV